MNTFNNHIISWEAPEFIQHEKGLVWFVVAGIGLLIFCVWGVLSGNWTLVIALLTAAVIYVWAHGQTPKHVKILVSKTGIKIGEREYPYQNIKSFWIIYTPPDVKTLNIQANSKILPDISIQLGDQDPAELRTLLCAHVMENEGREETFSESLIRTFKL